MKMIDRVGLEGEIKKLNKWAPVVCLLGPTITLVRCDNILIDPFLVRPFKCCRLTRFNRITHVPIPRCLIERCYATVAFPIFHLAVGEMILNLSVSFSRWKCLCLPKIIINDLTTIISIAKNNFPYNTVEILHLGEP